MLQLMNDTKTFGGNKMIEIYDQKIGEIPLLEIVQNDLRETTLPTVIYYHGWTNVKERVLAHGYEIARQGIRVLIPEALYHGGRSDGKPIEEHLFDFWQIVEANILELPTLVGHYSEKKLTDPTRVGVAGLSMGGITTCGLMATYPNIKAANCLMGAPDIKAFTETLLREAGKKGFKLPENIREQLAYLDRYNLALQPEKIAGRPFHFWHGTADGTVPYQNSYQFYTDNRDTEAGRNLTYTTTDDAHRVPHDISLETAQFFKNVL